MVELPPKPPLVAMKHAGRGLEMAYEDLSDPQELAYLEEERMAEERAEMLAAADLDPNWPAQDE